MVGLWQIAVTKSYGIVKAMSGNTLAGFADFSAQAAQHVRRPYGFQQLN